MYTCCRVEGGLTLFIVAGADSDYHPVLRALGFLEIADGFAKAYPTDAPGLPAMYTHFAQDAEQMVLQAAGVERVPWDAALLALLERLERLKRTGRPQPDWFLGGSAALAVRGLEVQPHDVDLAVDAAGAHILAEVLAGAMIGPVEDASGWICEWFGRAFLFARIEWVGGVRSAVDTPHPTDYGPTAANRLERIDWHGYSLRVPPLDLQLQVSARRGLHDRVRKIHHAMRDSSRLDQVKRSQGAP